MPNINSKITHLGAEHSVTGSCHLLQVQGLNILIDCGITQGSETLVTMNQWPVKPSDINFLFLTHAHIDHIGRVPELIQNGFKGEIICTHATQALLPLMLQDALNFSDLSKDKIEKIISDIEKLSWGFEYQQSFDLRKGIKFSLGRAGHILGSCWIRFELPDGFNIVFSGDLGAKNTPILPDPDIPEPCDLLIMESTYGDKTHEDRTLRVQKLGNVLIKALSDKGKVLIPAFALGRVQELIYEMDRLFLDPGFPFLNSKTPIPVFIDSPLGLRITEIYSSLSEYWDKEAKELLQKGDHPIKFKSLYGVENHADHIKLMDISSPAIIVAGSGMCNGGRIIDHLKTGLNNPKTDILFVGYQAKGTIGREILTNKDKSDRSVLIDGKSYPNKASVHQLTGYSGHADQQGLIEWARAINPKLVKLIHGEQTAQSELKKQLTLHNIQVS
ncbi:MAG: MBL fold metallo-hydrolase [Desulfobacterales bacterium]|nr:MBL fold metallo-hydrolase [Desulfobacterales bacterium]